MILLSLILITFISSTRVAQVKEPDYESMAMGKVKYLPPRFMTVNTAVEQLLEVESKRQEGILSKDSLAVGMARLGQQTQQVCPLITHSYVLYDIYYMYIYCYNTRVTFSLSYRLYTVR